LRGGFVIEVLVEHIMYGMSLQVEYKNEAVEKTGRGVPETGYEGQKRLSLEMVTTETKQKSIWKAC
jgi:hypothetical protein